MPIGWLYWLNCFNWLIWLNWFGLIALLGVGIVLVWHVNLPLARRFQRLRLRLQVRVRVSLLGIWSSNFRYCFVLFVGLAVAIVWLVFVMYYDVSFSSDCVRALFPDE